MADNKDLRSSQDRVRIDVNDRSEVAYVEQQFPELEHEQVIEAIEKAGPDRKSVMEWLKKTYRV